MLSVLVIVAFANCTAGEAKSSADITDDNRIPAIEMADVSLEQPEFTVELPGELLAFEEVDIYAKARAFVKKIHVDRGDYVRKGQLLAVLEAPELSDAYSSKKSSGQTAYQKYLFSKQAYERLVAASKKAGSIAAIELERAYSQLLSDSTAYESIRAEASASSRMADYLMIRAPFSGVITSRNVSEGALVGEGRQKPVFKLSQTDQLRLTVAIPEKEKNALNTETVAEFTLIDLPGESFKAGFSRSGESVDAALRSVIVEFDVENKNKKLSAGQYAKVRLNLKRKYPTLWVPNSSVVQSQMGSFVVKSDGGQARRVFVSKGVSRDGLTEIFGDLHEADKVLKNGTEEIKEGTPVAM